MMCSPAQYPVEPANATTRALADEPAVPTLNVTGGVANTCKRGHEGRFCAFCAEGYEKGDDGVCRQCNDHSAFLTLRLPILYGVVYGGYSTFRSGRPGSLKSYKATNFIFFMQTMQVRRARAFAAQSCPLNRVAQNRVRANVSAQMCRRNCVG